MNGIFLVGHVERNVKERLFVSDEECSAAVSEQHLGAMVTNTSLEGKRVSRFASNLLDQSQRSAFIKVTQQVLDYKLYCIYYIYYIYCKYRNFNMTF